MVFGRYLVERYITASGLVLASWEHAMVGENGTV